MSNETVVYGTTAAGTAAIAAGMPAAHGADRKTAAFDQTATRYATPAEQLRDGPAGPNLGAPPQPPNGGEPYRQAGPQAELQRPTVPRSGLR